MKFPRRLCRTAQGPQAYCEEDDPQAAFLVGPKGMEVSDLEAERNGITAYFARTAPPAHAAAAPAGAEAKEDGQVNYEDKAEEGPKTGLHVDPEQRMGRRR